VGTTLQLHLANLGATQDDFNEFAAILFQLFYTLQVFAEIGLVHNDLHGKNIYVAELDNYATNYYQVDGRVYRLTSMLQVRIFDFDRAAKLPTAFDSTEIINLKLDSDYCPHFGQCNALNANAELFLLAVTMFVANKTNPLLREFVLDIVPEDLLTRPYKTDDEAVIVGKTLAHNGRLCACRNASCLICTIIKDARIMSYRDILAMPLFDQFLDKHVPSNAFVWKFPSQASLDARQTWTALAALTSSGKRQRVSGGTAQVRAAPY
jgi:hypothetical protein